MAAAYGGRAPRGVPGGYPYIPPTYGYGGTYIYPLYVPMGVPIYTWGVGGVVRGYLYIPTIYVYVHMLIYMLYICMCVCLYT